jgi:osmotically-inducible protein OsmY
MTSDRLEPRSERELEADAARRLSRQPEAGRFPERRSWLTRTTDEVASWFGNTGAMRRRQWDEAAGDHSGEGPTRFVDADTRIVEELNGRLTADRELNASNVKVSSLEGVVTLDGSVATSAGAQRAANLALAVRGVRQVTNNLTVV